MTRVSPAFPERVGWYELLAPIGAGGMATVYLGLAERSGGFQRQVAVKMIHGTAEADPQLAADLMREAKLVAKIRHPNVVPVLDVGDDAMGLFLVMEYIEGDNLSALRRAAKRVGKPIPDAIALRIISEALAGLHAAHELRDENGKNLEVVHRDFSPQNILVGTDGICRLTDFGIAKAAYTAGHTRTGKIKGKIAYMSPEQARGVKVDRRCDVWAAGVVTWEVLTGKRLFDSEDEIAVLLKIVNEDPPRLAGVRPDLPPALDQALASALCRELAQRCPTADQLRRQLLAAHPVADTAEVAEFVREIVGPKLAERAKKIAEIRRQRGKQSDPVSGVGPSTAPTTESTLTEFEAEPHPSKTEATLTRVHEDTTGHSISWKSTNRPSHSSPSHSTRGVTNGVERSLEWALGNRSRRATVLGVAGGLLVFLVAMSFIAIRKFRSTPEPVANVTTLEPAAPAPAPTTSIESLAPPTTAAAPMPFVVHANAEIEALKIGDQTIPIAEPAKEIELETRPAAGTRIEATAKDGRKTRATVLAESDRVALEFPAARATAPRVTAPSGGTKSGGSGKDSPFADNPYKKGKP